jgi:hypothetical protein
MTHLLAAAARLRRMDEGRWATRLDQSTTIPSGNADGPVSITVETLDAPDHRYRVGLVIAEGVHLNAPGGEAPGLVTLSLSSPTQAIDVTYPEGVSRRYAFADEPLNVYEGKVVLDVSAERELDRLTLHYQACTDAACLTPAELHWMADT